MFKHYQKVDDLVAVFHQHEKYESEDLRAYLTPIRHALKKQGTQALLDYTLQFDQVQLTEEHLIVTKGEVQKAYEQVDTSFIDAVKLTLENLASFQKKLLPNNVSFNGTEEEPYRLSACMKPLSAVGLYVPGGRAAYPSTAVMNAVPATLAGVKDIIMVTPPQKDGTVNDSILVVANECGVETICKVGGAQSIFAIADGSTCLPKVDKIVGPGNKFVDTAKQMVYGTVDIDKPAGPSDVVVYVDEERYLTQAVYECLAQLEHDPDASAVLLVSSNDFVKRASELFEELLSQCSRHDIIKQSCKNGGIFVCSSPMDAVTVINHLAPEHLALISENALALAEQVDHAGAVFVGPYSPVALGDYLIGSNHVLPTCGAARFSSALSVLDFMKFSTHIHVSDKKLKTLLPSLKVWTGIEGFDAHYKSAKSRLNNET